MPKGPAWEREVCKKLSLWWSMGIADDCFWRTHNSGGRATQRHKKGRMTRGQYGDICATHPDAKPFTDVFTVELKRGYPRATIADLLDRKSTSAIQPYEKFIGKVAALAEIAGTQSWLLITRRDGREPLVTMSFEKAEELSLLKCYPSALVTAIIRPKPEDLDLFTMNFSHWLEKVHPNTIRGMASFWESDE